MTSLNLSSPVPITSGHELSDFDSGVLSLDEWLKKRAFKNHAAGASRCFVLCNGNVVVGYYSLSAGASKWLEMLGALDGTRKVADQANNSPRWARTPDLSTEPVVHDVA